MENQFRDQSLPSQPPPAPVAITPLVFILSLVIASSLTGIIVYLWQHKDTVILRTTPAETSIASISSPTPADRRVALSIDQWNEKFLVEFKKGVSCEQFITSRFSSPANTFVTYSNDKKGYSIDVPYNSAWGDSDNSVLPFEIHNSATDNFTGIGQLHGSEGCGPMRMFLRESAVSTIDQTIKAIDAQNQKRSSNPNNAPGDGVATYTKLNDFNFPVLKIDTGNALMGSVVSYKVFLPKVTLDLEDFFVSDQTTYTRLINTIKAI